MDYEASPFPPFRWERVYRTYECSQCGKVVRFGQLAFLPGDDLDEDDDDEEDERDDDEDEHDPFAYQHPKYILCSQECLKSAESDHWEDEAAERKLWEGSERSVPARPRAKTRGRRAASGGRTGPIQPDRQTDRVARLARAHHHVDDEKAEAVVTSFSDAVADICLRLEEAATVLKWAESQRKSHEHACDCDRCTLAKRLRGEFATLTRAVRALLLG